MDKQGTRGHRTVPHTADMRLEAWGPTREACLEEAALGMVAAFADTTGARPHTQVRAELTADTDTGLLTALLDEIVFRLDVYGDVPVGVRVAAVPEGLEARLDMTDRDDVECTGAAPKAVSLSGLRLSATEDGWTCAATVDV
jgi:SHS2 domain-containing protein